MKKIINIIVITFFLLIFLFLGYYLRGYYAKIKKDTYIDGWNDAKDRLIEYGLYEEMIVQKRKSVFGKILSINDDNIKIKIKPLYLLADPSLGERIIKIDNNTKIYKRIKNNDNVINEYNILNKENFLDIDKNDIEKSKYSIIEIEKDYLQKNQQVIVTSKYDLTDKKNILAHEIIIEL